MASKVKLQFVVYTVCRCWNKAQYHLKKINGDNQFKQFYSLIGRLHDKLSETKWPVYDGIDKIARFLPQ